MHQLESHLVPGIGMDAVGGEVQWCCARGVLVLDVAGLCGNCVHILEGKVIVVRAPQEQKSGIQDGPPVEAQLGSLLQYEDREVTLLPLQARPGRVQAKKTAS